MNEDFLKILREIRGTGVPGSTPTNGIWYELTKDTSKNGNEGIYGDILAKYGDIDLASATLDQAKNIIEGFTVSVDVGDYGTSTTNTMGTDGNLNIKIPEGIDGIDGKNGLTPTPIFRYNSNTGDIEVKVEYVEGIATPTKEW